MKHVDHIIHSGWILTGDLPFSVLENHALIVNQGKIEAILDSETVKTTYSSTKVEHFPSHVILPGLINAHTHLSMNYFRGLADDLALMDWLNNHIWPAEGKWVSPEFVRDASLFAMAEMIRGGSTCFNDMYFFLEATAEAAEIAGVRAHIGMTILDFPTPWAKTPDDYFEKGLAFLKKYQHHPLIKPTLAPHAPYTVSDPYLLRAQTIAEEFNLQMNIHVHETADEVNQSLEKYKKRPLQRLQELGLLTPRLIAIHMTQLTDEDINLLAEGRSHVVHCPESNMKLASGICPVAKLRARQINVALGTDGAASNNDLDMISEMQSAAFLAKLSTLDPTELSAAETLTMATLHGAKALGIDHLTGSLLPGKSADFIAIDLDQIETLPLYHPISQIVYAASRNQVTDVWVAGKQLMKKRELLTLDEGELKNTAKAWAKKIRAGG